MTFNLTSAMVPGQIPDHIAEDYPKFVEFLQVYYEFLETFNINLESLKDVDLTSEPLLYFFKQELAKRFPNSAINERKFLRSVKELYSRKGTFDGIELLFRLFFNESIIIREPSKQILRASDGKWQQDNFFTISTKIGSALDSRLLGPGVSVFVANEYGIFTIDTVKIVPTTTTSVRVYYSGSKYLKLNLDEIVEIRDSSGNVLYTGTVKPSVSKLKIVQPGKNWLAGQVFTVPSTSNSIKGVDTIARVTGITADGGIRTVEIYEHGFEHANNQIVQISPFPNKPSSGSYDLKKTLVAVNPDAFDYELTINDYIEQIKEDIVGTSDVRDINSYFLEDYVESGYEAKQVIRVSTTQSSPPLAVLVDPSLTLENWLESQAYLAFSTDIIVKGRGQFLDDRGQISNAQIRLQDNYYYQLFSYVIETTTGIDQYRSVLDLIHPAGLKYFGSLNKTSAIVYDEELNVYRTISNDTIYQLDIAETEDLLAKIVEKAIFDDFSSVDEINSKELLKLLLDESATNDLNLEKIFSKVSSDISTVDDSAILNSSKALIESTNLTTDSKEIGLTKQFNNSTPGMTDSLASLAANKYIGDGLNVNDGTSSITTDTVIYNAEDYFSEEYSTIDYNITIG